MKKRIFLCLGPGQMCVILSLLETWSKKEDQSQYEDHLFIAAHDYRDAPTHTPYVEAIRSMAKFWPFKSVYDFCKLSIDHGSRWDMKNQEFLQAFHQELIKDSGIDSCDMIITTRNWRVDYGILFWCFPEAKFICIGDGLNGVLEFSTRKSLPQPDEIWHTFPIYAFRTEYHKYAYPEKHHLIPYKNVRKTINKLQSHLELPRNEFPNGAVFYLSQNLAELGHLSLDEEVQFFIDKIVSWSVQNQQPIVFKPHPRDSSQKIEVFKQISQNASIRMEVLALNTPVSYLPAEVLTKCFCVRKIITISSSGTLLPYLIDHIPVEMYPEYDKRINLITSYKYNYPSTLPHLYKELTSGKKLWDGSSDIIALPNPEASVFYALHPVLKYFSDVGGFYTKLPGFDPKIIQEHFDRLPAQEIYCKDTAIYQACMAILNNDIDSFLSSFAIPQIAGFELTPEDISTLKKQFKLIKRCWNIYDDFGASHWEQSVHLHSHLISEFSGLFSLIHKKMYDRLFTSKHNAPNVGSFKVTPSAHESKSISIEKSAFVNKDLIIKQSVPTQKIHIQNLSRILSRCTIQQRDQTILIASGTIVLPQTTITHSTFPFSIVHGSPACTTHLFDFEKHSWIKVKTNSQIQEILAKRNLFPSPSDQELEIIINQMTLNQKNPAKHL